MSITEDPAKAGMDFSIKNGLTFMKSPFFLVAMGAVGRLSDDAINLLASTAAEIINERHKQLTKNV